MMGIVLSAEQIKTAPAAVRQWLEEQMATEIAPAIVDLPQQPPRRVLPDFDPERIAACSLPEVLQIFERIRYDGLACRLFLEFGQEPAAALHPSPLYALDLADIIADTGIDDGKHLAACINLINSAVQVVRGEPDATLFAFDAAGRCYVHELTHRALHLLRHDLLAARAAPRESPHIAFPVTCDPPYRCVEAPAPHA